MDQHNQKSLLPDFSTNGFSGQFNGLPHGNTNSIMSTLQSLQMQTMGNQMIPQTDLQTDFQNSFLLEQIQLRAMQSMYNSFNGNQKLDPKFSQASQSNLTMPHFTTMTGNEPSTSNNVYSSIPSTSGFQNFQSVSQPTIPPTIMPSLTVQSSLMIDNRIGDNLNMKLAQPTIPQAQAAVEDWMRNICVDSLLDPFKDKTQPSTSTVQPMPAVSFNTPTTPTASVTALNDAINIATSSMAQKPETPPIIQQVPTTSTAIEKPVDTSTSGMDYDEAHDDVDNIFGLSLAENDVRSGSMYRRPSSADRGLSPIDFTPPDSPQPELTFDEIFGISEPKEPPAVKPTIEPTSNDVPSTSADNAPVQSANTSSISTTTKEEDDFINNFVKPKNIPVYKQKAALMSLEAREAAKKDDPNYDAFEFEDDDDLVFGGSSTEVRREPEAVKKVEPMPKNVYITGVGFEIQNSKDKDHHTRRWHQKPVVAHINHESHNDKAFLTVADKIRTRKNKQMTCSFLKPEQSNSTECAKNMRKITQDEPRLPKFIIRIDQLQTHTDEPITTRKRYRRKKNKSENEDSDFDDVTYKKRKTTKKVYTLHKDDPSIRKTVLEFPVGPCVPEADRKRIGMFGPAEGILPKGTYVVCKSDILKEDIAVWRVDNQNLLQKFPPFRDAKTNKLLYRSSSTYSGWCEQISSQYFRVSVRVIKQTRSETTVEPEIALNELFCASSIEWFRHPGTVFIKEEKETVAVEDDAVLTEPRRISLNTLVNTYLSQVFTTKYVENLLEKNDYTYTRSLSEIETNNKQCEELIKKRIPVEPRHNKWIQKYTRLAISKSSYHCLTKCQICKRKKPRRIIHFFDKTCYNAKLTVENLVENIRDENEEDEEFPPVADAISCGRCSMAVDFLHRMHHIHFHMLRICEDKLEEIGTTDIDLTADKIVEVAKADKGWTLSVIQKYCDLWDQARYEFRDV